MTTHAAPDPSAATHPPTAVIGGGTMARAILAGARDAGVLNPGWLVIAEPHEARRVSLAADLGAKTTATGLDAIRVLAELEAATGEAGVLMLAVKPQMLSDVAGQLVPVLAETSPDGAPPRILISILAGATTAGISGAFDGRVRVVRVMPNTPAQIRRGVSALARGHGITDIDLAWPRRLFEAVGDAAELPESSINAFTALAGSGPAYVFYLTEALAKAGEAMGLDPELAARFARGTVTGSAELMARDDRPPEALRAAVTSKGGTTAAACETFDRLGLKGIIEAGMRANAARSEALEHE